MRFRSGIDYISHLPRYREVVNILIKHGFGSIFDRFTLWRLRGRDIAQAMEQETRRESIAKRMRIALEELGPTFIKIGQLLSTRPDLLGAEYIIELEKLQNDVPPFSYEALVNICAGEGIDIEEDFLYFNPQPLAAASIAQVHEAVLKSGQKVVLKVQRPGIDKTVETDLEILAELSKLAEKRISWGEFYKVSELIDELAEALHNELDFGREAKNAEIFYRNFEREKNVLIPRVIWEFSSRRILTLEYIEGIKISDFLSLKKAGYDSKIIAGHLIDALFKQVYEHGFFHADPHPGNIAIAEGEKIILYDFGQVGQVDQLTKEKAVSLLIGMMRYDVNMVSRTLLDIGIGSQNVNQEEFKRDVSRLQQKYYGLPLAEINISKALMELIELSVKYQMRLPAELSLLLKMLMTVEGIVSQLDPQLSIVDMAEPYGKKILRKRFSTERLQRDLEGLSYDYFNLLKVFPREIDNILKIMEAGELTIRMEHANLKRLNARLDVVSNRLSVAIIIASIIIGTSLVVDKSSSKLLAGIPLVEVGFLSAMVLGLFLVYSLIRSGKY